MDTRGTLSSPYPPCDIVMPYFSQKRRENYQWYSRPFYSAPGGYKLRLSVFANGYGNGKGTHVSLGIFLMKGENDDHLEWPFKHDVMYRILNWKRDEKHVVSKIAFKNAVRGENARVTTAITTANGGGQPKVLSHALLYDSKDEHVQYLNEDCLCVEVLAVEPPK